MSAPNPQVSVFHFTSRISSAKIRKYKLATERGMSSGGGNVSGLTATSGNLEAASSPSMDPSTTEPPAKRPKLKLNVRRPSESPDTIAVSRPKRDSTLRIRYSENMVIDSKDLEEAEPQRKSRPSPAASSDLSSLTSVHSTEKELTPAPAPAPVESKTKKRDYSRDFMSYYVTGGDEDEDEPEVVEPDPEPEPKPKKQKSLPSQPQPAHPTRLVIPDQPVKTHRSESQPQPPTYPTSKLQPPRPAIPQPVVQVIDNATKPAGPREPDTVAGLIKKLENLSTALTNFGGIPALPLSPQEEVAQAPEPPPSKERKDVDDFLAMFDDDDSDDNDSKEPKTSKAPQDLNSKLENPGEADTPLTFGIQFIQNALRSWAIQRNVAQYQQQRLQYEQARQMEAQQKRGPGRPRKFDTDEGNFRPPSPTAHIKIEMAKTPEGAAIAAFQDVIDSGCLQVNAVLPVPLTRSLRRLYMQIDHLINQGSRNEPQWQCMSYSAQITAQKSRVEKWKIAHAKAQQEMVRQHQLAQQQVMQQMGIPQHQRNMTVEQAQQQHAIDLERKRGLRDAAQQPHLTQYLTNPLRLNTQPAAGHAHSAQHVNNASAGSPGANGVSYPNGLPLQASSGDGRAVQLDKIKLYMPNFLPRSGQSMKFSFAPHNELALHTFGAQAFPTNEPGPNIPNRGPMSANTSVSIHHAHSHLSNGNAAVPVVPSNAPKQVASDDDDVEMLDARPVSRKSTGDVDGGFTNGTAVLNNTINSLSGSSTTVPLTSGARSSSVPVLSSDLTSLVAEMPNGVNSSGSASPVIVTPTTATTPSMGAKGKSKAIDERIAQPEVMVIDQ